MTDMQDSRDTISATAETAPSAHITAAAGDVGGAEPSSFKE